MVQSLEGQHDANTDRAVSVGQMGTVATHSSADGRKLLVDFDGAGRWHVLARSVMRTSEFKAALSCSDTQESCRHTHDDGDVDRLSVRPSMSVSVLSVDPQVLLVRNFLTLEEIQTLTDIADTRFRPSRLQHYGEGMTVSALRNSSSADIGPPHAFHPRVMAILKRMSALTGLN